MKTSVRLCVLTLSSGLVITASAAQPPTSSPGQCWNPAATIPLSGNTCGTVQDLQLSCYLPADQLGLSSPTDFNVIQRSSDVFSWQEFIALNWPARPGARGEPDWTRSIAAPGPRVWETWKEENEVYLKNGEKPKPWNDPQTAKLLYRTQKIDDVLDSTTQAAAATGTLPSTLTDQKGRLVRSEIRLNKVLFDYIVAHQLYDGTIQAAATAIAFPPGAMLIKAAWREVARDEEARFHTVTARVCDRKNDGTLRDCRDRRMGLVGFHITQKTPSAPQWIWSTFEQIDNVPDAAARGPLSFNNPRCDSCPANRQTRPGTANQIVRSLPIPAADPDCSQPQSGADNVRRLNEDVQQALRQSRSVFQHYELIDTQWPVPPTQTPPSTAFSVFPVELGNTTMESFVQPTSTCMGCHSTARTVNANSFVSSDFSFTLNNAQPQTSSCKIIHRPNQPLTAWDREHWTDVTRGYALATHTYEMLPQFVPTARLHCASCHLNAGANADAAWWVDLTSEYPTRPLLQARINQCFRNSLNGQALCTPASGTQAGDCDANANMTAFTTYMQWLDEQAARLPLCPAVAHGFPAIPPSTGVAASGQQTFVQKCAVCHALDGQGRYEDQTYFRPALWGPESFNAAAGMFADPADLAAFIRWNMPLMAGGELTNQEAWNLEAFIHSKPRPK